MRKKIKKVERKKSCSRDFFLEREHDESILKGNGSTPPWCDTTSAGVHGKPFNPKTNIVERNCFNFFFIFFRELITNKLKPISHYPTHF